ncbi:MAG: gamma-glutamylcyclotransferase family protein, partial [Candidatus Sericytochromatia bacterium]
VYDVDQATLRDLDALEEYPDFCDRQPIRLEDGEEVLAYTLREDQVAGLPVIPSGDWKQFRRSPPEGRGLPRQV